jgi:type II secretory pathway pseudopilin PulG
MRAKVSLVETLVIASLCLVIGAVLGGKLAGTKIICPVDRLTIVHSQIASALESYRADHGSYPPANQGLAVLLGTNGGPAYLRGELKDPWGRLVSYFIVNGKPVIGFSIEPAASHERGR